MKNKSGIQWLIAICAAAAFCIPSELPALGAVIAYWRFENGASDAPASGADSILDSSGNAHNGTPIASPVYRSQVAANPIPGTGAANGLSIDFSTTSQYITVPDASDLQLTGSLTLEAYILSRGPGAGPIGGSIVFRGDNRPGFDPYRISISQNGQTAKFQITNASDQLVTLSAPIPLNAWVHVAGTLDNATGSMRIYTNGVLVDSITTAVRPFAALQAGQSPGLGIGNLQVPVTGGLNPEPFNGLIDEVRISNQALIPSQFVPEPGSSLLLAGALGFLARRRVRPAMTGSWTQKREKSS